MPTPIKYHTEEERHEARKAATRRWYWRNREYMNELGKQRYWKHKRRANKIKSGLGCAHCGETDFRCLDFHHLDPSTKSFEVSSAWVRSWKDLESEIAKCGVLCANCHRKAHIDPYEGRGDFSALDKKSGSNVPVLMG